MSVICAMPVCTCSCHTNVAYRPFRSPPKRSARSMPNQMRSISGCRKGGLGREISRSCDRAGQLQNRKAPKSRKLETNRQKKTGNLYFCLFFSRFSPNFPYCLSISLPIFWNSGFFYSAAGRRVKPLNSTPLLCLEAQQ